MTSSRKRGMARRVGMRTLHRWTPKRAHNFAMTRVNDIEKLLVEITVLYDEVDQYTVNECERIKDEVLPVLREAIDGARELGASL